MTHPHILSVALLQTLYIEIEQKWSLNHNEIAAQESQTKEKQSSCSYTTLIPAFFFPSNLFLTENFWHDLVENESENYFSGLAFTI